MRAVAGRPVPRPDDAGDARLLPLLADVSVALRCCEDLATLLDVVAAAARAAFGEGEARLFLVDGRSGAVRPWDAARGASGEPCLPAAGGVVDWVLRREEAVFGAAARGGGPRLEPEAGGERGRGFLALPLAAAGSVYGAWVMAFPVARVFGPGERRFARLLGDALSVALERESRARELAETAAQVEQLEERAEDGESLLAQMLSVVAHEMRTPLTCIKAYAETLIDIPEDQFKSRVSFLEIINEECDRLGRLLTNALDYSRLESGQRSFHLSTLLPGDLLGDVLLTLAPEAKRRKVELRAQAPEGFDSVEGDCDLLKQLCINLVGNAIKFSPEGTAVDLAVSGDGERWRLEVADRGPGIPEDQRERIFERFYRVESEGRKAVPGTGLGLAIVRYIAELHGGRVWAAPNPEGGSVFHVDLPRVQRAPETARGVARELWGRPEVERLLGEGVQVISEVMEAQIVSAMLVDPERGDLRVVAAVGLGDGVFKRRVGYRGGIAGKALAQAAPVLVNDIENDPRFRRPNHPQYTTKSFICVPLLLDGQAVGVINVNNKRSRQPFDEQDLELLSSIAARLGAAALRTRALAGTPAVLEQEMQALRAAIVPPQELVLGRRTAAAVAHDLARRLGADEAEACRLARLADGLRGIGDRGPAEETAGSAVAPAVAGPVALPPPAPGARRGGRRGRAKPASGARPARAAPGVRVVQLGETREILLGRHERWDGSGQPRGLAGEAAPLGARVLAVVDALRALTQGSAYRPAMAPEAVLAELERVAGEHLDARVVALLAELAAEDGGRPAAALGGGRRGRGA
jgi:signal transduction histidine kinase